MKRPAGVIILALLHWIEALLFVLAAALLYLWARLISQLGSGNLPAAGVPPEILALILRVANPRLVFVSIGLLLVFTALFIALGIGLWKLRNWARRLTLGLTVLRLVVLVPGLVYLVRHFEPVSFAVQLLFAAVYLWILWYLFRPRVKHAFGKS